MNLNKVILIGRIASDIRMFDSKNGIQIARFNLAITRDSYSNSSDEITDFISIVAFRNNATFISKFFSKGDLVNIVGNLQSSQYSSKSGEMIYSLNVIVDQIKSLEPRSITQARMEKNNTTINNNQSNNQSQATFYEENRNDSSEEKDSPWELDL